MNENQDADSGSAPEADLHHAAESEREITIEILRLIGQNNGRRELMRAVTLLLHEWSGCEAVGIRVREGEDFPYFETRGFPAEFVLAENRLCAVNSSGAIERDGQGNPVLVCMCGVVLRGRCDPSKPFFTAHGSFWTNSTSQLLATTTAADRQARTRNRCSSEGYESVALIPLRAWGETFGLLQFNDRRKERFTVNKIALLEHLADNVALGLAQRQAQEALRENATRLESAVQAGNVGLWEWDLRTDRVLHSLNSQRPIGSEDQELAHNFAEWQGRIHPDDRDRCLQSVRAFIEKPWPDFRLEFRYRHGDGSYRSLLAQASLARDDEGKAVRMLGAYIDITDRKRAEEALRESEERFRLTFDQLPIGAAISSLEYRYLRVNEMLCRITGYSSEELIGRHFPDITHPDDRVQDLQLAQRLVAGEIDHYEMEKRYLRKDGKVVWIRLVSRLVKTASGEPLYFLPTMQDITDRKRAEEALRESERRQAEAERLAVAGRMAAIVAHEINNPLAGIKNSFRLIKNAVPADHPDQDMVGRIEREIDRIAQIVRQMYQIYSPRTEELIDISVGEIVRNVVELLDPLFREHDVGAEVEDIPRELTVRAYEGSLQQVMFNLLANAVQASPRAAVVRVTAGPADSVGQDHVRISICDRGPGIPAEIRAKMFEPFVTADAGSAPNHGLGLGLAIVKNIVESLRGRITVEGAPGDGTCFHVDLPAK
jgi:PAS domain S-box-containing protein